MIKVYIKVRNTHFTVQLPKELNHVISDMEYNLVTYKLVPDKYSGRMKKHKDKEYFDYDPVEECYRFCVNNLKDFMILLGRTGITREEIDVSEDKRYPVESLEADTNEDYTEHGYQKRYIKALLKPKGYVARLVDLIMGKGKSLIASFAASKLNMKIGMILLPKYINKWKYDIQEYLDIESDEVFIVQGGDSLKELLETKEDYKVVLFSITTLLNYIKDYHKNPHKYSVNPPDLLKKLKIGTIINDESHQHFHAVFRILLYLNPVRVIGLSATLDSNDKNMKRIYHILYPEDARVSNLLKYINYLLIYAVRYRLQMTSRIQYKRAQGYNHNLFEQSVMKNSVFLDNYIDMIAYYVKRDYIDRKEEGQKCLIFASSIKLCTIIRNHLANLYEDLDVRRYVEQDPYENVQEADICVSTVISSGTAIDIPGLITVVQSISIGSLQANLQAAGRLREIKGTDVKYVYVYTPDISNQANLHKQRLEALKPKAKKVYLEEYHKTVETF